MPKENRMKCIMLIAILLITAGCDIVQANIVDNMEYIVGVYSSYLDDKGELVMIDFKGNFIKTKEITGRMITSIKEVEHNKVSILPIASKKEYLGDFEELEEIELDAVPVTQDYKNGIHVISYQKDLSDNFMVWRNKHAETKRLDFGECYLPAVKINQDSIYVICEMIDENEAFLYKVDISTGEIADDMKLMTSTGYDIEFTENYILIGSTNNIIVIDNNKLKQKKIKTPTSVPYKLLVHDEELIVQYLGSNIVSFLDINSFQEMRRIEHDDKIKTVFLREGRLYVSSLNKHNQDTITLYDLETLKLIKKIKIRSNGKHFLTDFIVTNFAG